MVSDFLITTAINIMIIIALFYLSVYLEIPVLVPFLTYGTVMASLGIKRNLTGIVMSFNQLGMLTGQLVFRVIYGSKPPPNTKNYVAWNEKANRVHASMSVIFWLILGTIIQIIQNHH